MVYFFNLSILSSELLKRERFYTQTEAHLSKPQINEGINGLIATIKKIKKDFEFTEEHKALISSMLKKERELAESHYVFYHGQRFFYLVLSDLIKEIHFQETGQRIRDNFYYLRIPQEDKFNETLESLLAHVKKSENPDFEKEISSISLSSNVSLYANSAFPDDASLYYFLINFNVHGFSWGYIFKEMGLDKSYVNEIKDLTDEIQTNEGVMVQIFIPKDRVNKYVYLAKSFGKTLNAKRTVFAIKGEGGNILKTCYSDDQDFDSCCATVTDPEAEERNSIKRCILEFPNNDDEDSEDYEKFNTCIENISSYDKPQRIDHIWGTLSDDTDVVTLNLPCALNQTCRAAYFNRYPLKSVHFIDKEGISYNYDLKSIDPKSYLEIFCRNPEAINSKDMDNIQARILMSNDFMLNPASDVQIYAYTMMPEKKRSSYKKKLSDLAKKMLAHKKTS